MGFKSDCKRRRAGLRDAGKKRSSGLKRDEGSVRLSQPRVREAACREQPATASSDAARSAEKEAGRFMA